MQSENISLEQLTIKINEIAEKSLEPTYIHFTIDSVLKKNKELSLSPNEAKNIIMICREAFNNIVKHSYAHNAKIEFNLTEKNLFLCISDDGTGNINSSSTGNGLKNMRMRAINLKGKIDIKVNDTGTKIILTVPV